MKKSFSDTKQPSAKSHPAIQSSQKISKAKKTSGSGSKEAPDHRGALPAIGGFGTGRREAVPAFRITAERLKNLSLSDPVVWAILKVRKDQVTQCKWDIVPDLDGHFADIDRWEQTAIKNLNEYGITTQFKPVMLDQQHIDHISEQLEKIIAGSTDAATKEKQIAFFFECTREEMKQDALIHANHVKKTFDRPNNLQTSWTELLKVLVDDILCFDSGVLVKNFWPSGELAELYTLPGFQIKPILNEDGSVPMPPESAYAYFPQNTIEPAAEFTNDELVRFVDSPNHYGQGVSPLELAVFIITASIYSEKFNLDYLKHSNMPPALINLGKEVTDEQRRAFRILWDQETRGEGGLHKILFTNGSEMNKDSVIPMRMFTNVDLQFMEYLKWTISIKCMAFQISPQDIGFVQDFHRSTAKVQQELSKGRGLKNLLSLLEGKLNSEIVKTAWKFNDVKFQWQDVDIEDQTSRSVIDGNDQRNGTISANERRAIRGEKPIKGGDKHYVYTASGLVALEDLDKMASAASDTEPEPAEGEGSGKKTEKPETGQEGEEFANPDNAPDDVKPSGAKQPTHQQGIRNESVSLAVKQLRVHDESKSMLIQAGRFAEVLETIEKRLKEIDSADSNTV